MLSRDCFVPEYVWVESSDVLLPWNDRDITGCGHQGYANTQNWSKWKGRIIVFMSDEIIVRAPFLDAGISWVTCASQCVIYAYPCYIRPTYNCPCLYLLSAVVSGCSQRKTWVSAQSSLGIIVFDITVLNELFILEIHWRPQDELFTYKQTSDRHIIWQTVGRYHCLLGIWMLLTVRVQPCPTFLFLLWNAIVRKLSCASVNLYLTGTVVMQRICIWLICHFATSPILKIELAIKILNDRVTRHVNWVEYQ